MQQHGHYDAWDEKEFNKMFDLFEEDDPNEVADKASDGLDKNEFTKLVSRMAQL